MVIEKNLPKGYLLNYDGKSPNFPTQIEIKPDLSQQQEQNILKVIQKHQLESNAVVDYANLPD